MAPVCTNCNGTDFVWANDLKTGAMGAGLSLRARGEVPLGARICRTCGHAELFLRDLTVLHQPHTWRPGEFVPIVARTTPKTEPHHHAPAASTPPAAPAAAPAPAPVPPPPPSAPAPPPPPPEPVEPVPALQEPAPSEPAPMPETEPTPAPGEPAKAKPTRRKSSKSKS